jgi:hypothetical protein
MRRSISSTESSLKGGAMTSTAADLFRAPTIATPREEEEGGGADEEDDDDDKEDTDEEEYAAGTAEEEEDEEEVGANASTSRGDAI